MYEEASSDVGKYLANPINAYLLVKRLTADWKQVEGVMTQNVGRGIFSFYLTILLEINDFNYLSCSIHSQHYTTS